MNKKIILILSIVFVLVLLLVLFKEKDYTKTDHNKQLNNSNSFSKEQLDSIDAVKKAELKEDKIIASFTGNGGLNTRPFQTNSDWEIKWDAKGDIFQLYLFDTDGNLLGVPANQGNIGKGSSYQPKKGRYYLQVNAIGNWEIQIIELAK